MRTALVIKQYRDWQFRLYHRAMAALPIKLDRARRTPLAAQIYWAIREAIETGRLASGARLPSWRDLAAQLGVSRGTVRVAYERLIDEQFAIGLGAAGTRVAERPSPSSTPDWSPEAPPLPDLFHDFGTAPLAFQMGVPSQDAFPFKLWSRILTREARRAAAAPVGYPDPRGDPELRKEIAAYLGIARGIRCNPSQVLVTAGFSGALGLAIRGLQLEGMEAWMEDPGFPLTRTALGLAGMTVTAVPVDAEGLDIAAGVRSAAAALAVVTPGQQAPLGMTMSLPRRLALLEWARRNDAWIIEDDYLSELQLKGRAAPALASLDHGGRVLHIGSFSKTISPALRLGFLVVPPEMAPRFGDARCLPGAGAGRARAARRGGIPARGALSSPSPPHEAALCRPTGGPASLLAGGGVRRDQGAGDRRYDRGDLASQVCVRRGHRFARPAVRPGAGSPFALVHAVCPAAGTAAQRDQSK